VAIIDGAKVGNEAGVRHTKTIVEEYNKANPENQVTEEELIADNDAFKEGNTTEKYRAVQEFIAESWEKYHTEGPKGFSKAFQDFLDQITEAFKAVYKSLKGEPISPQLQKMFDEILGKQEVVEQQVTETVEEVAPSRESTAYDNAIHEASKTVIPTPKITNEQLMKTEKSVEMKVKYKKVRERIRSINKLVNCK
jgi:hypothetical protein